MDLTGSSLVIVADGRRARFFEERRRGGPLIEVTSQLGDLAPHRPMAASHAGGSHERMGPASHTGDRPTPGERREDDFIDLVGARAADVMRRGDHQGLVLIAAPRALGRLRQAMAHARLTVSHAEARDRVSQTPDELRTCLRELRLHD